MPKSAIFQRPCNMSFCKFLETLFVKPSRFSEYNIYLDEIFKRITLLAPSVTKLFDEASHVPKAKKKSQMIPRVVVFHYG